MGKEHDVPGGLVRGQQDIKICVEDVAYYLNCSGGMLNIFMLETSMMASALLKDHFSVISCGIWTNWKRVNIKSSPIRLLQQFRKETKMIA